VVTSWTCKEGFAALCHISIVMFWKSAGKCLVDANENKDAARPKVNYRTVDLGPVLPTGF